MAADETVRYNAEFSRKNMAFLKAVAKGSGKSRSKVLNDILDALSGLTPGDRAEIGERYLDMSHREDNARLERLREGKEESASKHAWRRDVYRKVSDIMKSASDFECMMDNAPAI